MPPNSATRVLERAIDVLVLAVGWWLIALSVATCVEMVSRKLFAFSLQGVDEVGGYTLAIVGAIGFSYTLITRGHTRIDFLVSKMPERARSVLNMLAMVTLAAMVVFAVSRGWVVLSESIEFQSHSTTPLQTPMWVPQSMWLTGWALFAVVAVTMAVHSLALLLRGRHAELNKAYGPQTLEEEIESEAGDVLAELAAESQATAQAGARGAQS
jgi:TRAP-type mannitol/chloroaromatic compound transport system permease small subunit